MALYLVKYENTIYANNELYWTAVAGGERSFIKLLASKKVSGVAVFDQTLFPLTSEEQKKCEQLQDVILQDFDADYRYFNTISKERIKAVQDKTDDIYPDAWVLSIRREVVEKIWKHRHVRFFRVKDFNISAYKKYRMVPKMATVRICGKLYVAVDTVDARVEAPIIVTVSV